MVRQTCSVCMVATVMLIVTGCGEAPGDSSTYQRIVFNTPVRNPHTQSPTETTMRSALPDFKLPEGNTPGWLRFDNQPMYALIAFTPDSRRLAVSYIKGSITFFDMGVFHFSYA